MKILGEIVTNLPGVSCEELYDMAVFIWIEKTTTIDIRFPGRDYSV